MVRSNAWSLRVMAVGVAAVLTLAACGPGTSPGASAGQSAGESAGPSAGVPTGGTIYVLTLAKQIDQVDPQRAYTGEDLAFFGGLIYRALTAFKFSPDLKEGTTLVPDLATDTGTSSDAGKTWSFTLRDGSTWQDGSPVTCDDVKYGVSRTFATTVINQGPTYQIQYLDIPSVDGFKKKSDGTAGASSSSAYGGPYSDTLPIFSDQGLTKPIPNDKAAYDKAVVCDGKTITFHLAKPVGDFNYATTLGMFPVPKAADIGEQYGVKTPPVSNGPYIMTSYTTGNGGKMIFARNTKWSQASDPYRHAYPDGWEIDFGIDPKVIDQRMIANAGKDQFTIGQGGIQTENLATIFKDAKTPNDLFKGRALSSFDVYSRYLWINVQKVKNVKIRQAMAVALDRSAMRKNLGGDFYGDFADGAIKNNIGADYAPTGLWDTFFGKKIPDTGDPELAKKLIADSGEKAPTLQFDYPDTPVRGREAAIVIAALGKAGITVKPNPIEAGKYYSVVFDPAKAGEFGYGGWGADWPNASTVIAPLYTPNGGWDLSELDDPAFQAKIDAALSETDRAKQSPLWQALNKEAAEQMYTIPTFFGLTQRIAGTKVGFATGNGDAYLWAAYSSWPYGDMYVKP